MKTELNGIVFTLYGDGKHDDAIEIQRMLDTGISCVELPAPPKCYSIGRTLRVHANQTLKLPPTTIVRLLPDSNCIMLKNDPVDGHANIAVIGGIWDMANLSQQPNPLYTRTVNVDWTKGAYADDEYLGVPIRFYDVKHLTVSGITIKDPVTFGAQFARIEYFTIENITFDYNHGNPYAINMDGVHLDGGCRFGRITNLQGRCYDDLLALNADDFYCGPIEDISADGIFADECHSAVRLLSTSSNVRRIHIANVFGSFYQYCIGFTRYYDMPGCCGQFDQISLSNIYAEKYPLQEFHHKQDQDFDFDLVWIQDKLHVGNLQISNFHRRESQVPVAMIHVLHSTQIDVLSLEHISQENATGTPIPILQNEGTIGKLYTHDIQTCEEVIHNEGTIAEIHNVRTE